MKNLVIVHLIIFVCGSIFSQTWTPMGVPEGSGITDLVYWSGGGAVYGDKIWATTGSMNWPTGQRGGVFYSAVSGTYQGIWYRVGGSAGHYIGRTLAVGQDGNLYASLWRDPATFQADGLFKFLPQVGDFGFIYQAQAGDNIFSIAVKNNPHTIFAGTRNGIIRSTDNGTSFGYSNTGIPDSAWVYDIAIDSTGILALATSKGVFISTNNGDNWLTTTGIPPQDTAMTLLFVSNSSSTTSSSNSLQTIPECLYTGTHDGRLLRSFFNDGYTVFVLIKLFSDEEDEELSSILSLTNYVLKTALMKKNQTTSKFSGTIDNDGVYKSTDGGVVWEQINNGLPSVPPVSALASKVINETTSQIYAGLFNGATNGAGVYKLDVTVDVEDMGNGILSKYSLEQNYPNPFNPNTTIQFSIPEQSFVRLEMFNTLWEKVKTLVSEELNAGNYKYEWNAENLSSGVYFYRLDTEKFSEMKKMILLK